MGVILSMVIFVGFILFLYLIINPAIKARNSKQFISDSLYSEILDKISANLTTLKITNANIPSSFNCLKINVGDFGMENNFYVTDFDGNPIYSSYDGENISIDWSGNERGFNIYSSSEEFLSSPSGSCLSPISTSYVLNSISTKEEIFESKILNFIDQTNSNYENMKNLIHLPIDSEFSFSFIYPNGTEIGSTQNNVSVNVYADSETEKYIDRKGHFNFGEFIIKIW